MPKPTKTNRLFEQVFEVCSSKLIAQGAEAKLFLENDAVIKNRFQKKYRIKQLDNKLRGFRTRREAKVLKKLSAIGFPAPKLIECDEKENMIIEKISGELLKNVINEKNYEKYCGEIGRKAAILHNNGIIHGDLTTSNMILHKKHTRSLNSECVFFIDFGLSFFSQKVEDKAVDLHLLKEALESKHYQFWEKAFKAVMQEYSKSAKDAEFTLKRLEAIEKRGRYRAKKGS